MRRSILFVVLLMCIVPVSAFAVTRFVDPNPGGNCVGNYNPATRACGGGTFTSFTTIGAGVSATNSGDTLNVRAGTYTVSSSAIANPVSGSASGPTYTVFTGYQNERPIIQGSVNPDGVTVIWGFVCTGCSYVEIRGFEMRDLHNGINIVGAAHHYRIINNVINRTYGPCIFPGGTDGYAAFNDIARCGFYNSGYHGNNSVYGTSTRGIWEYNTFHNSGHGIAIFTGNTGDLESVTIRNNLFYEMGRMDLDSWEAGATGYLSAIAINQCPFTGNPHLIANNIIYNSGYIVTGPPGSEGAGSTPGFVGIGQSAGECASGRFRVLNNTLYNIGTFGGTAAFVYGIGLDNFGNTNTIARNNIAYLIGGGAFFFPNATGSGTIVASNNLSTNPNFVNPSAGDFRLQSGSAAIDTGLNQTACGLTTDFVGIARPTGGGTCVSPTGAAWDLGPYEFGGSPPPPPRFAPGINLRRAAWQP